MPATKKMNAVSPKEVVYICNEGYTMNSMFQGWSSDAMQQKDASSPRKVRSVIEVFRMSVQHV